MIDISFQEFNFYAGKELLTHAGEIYHIATNDQRSVKNEYHWISAVYRTILEQS